MSTSHNRGGAQNRGFIALISTVIIASILMGLALTVSGSGVFTRFAVLDSEYKRISLGLAESCANAALLKIAQDYNYTPGAGDTVQVGTDAQGRVESCTIKSITFPNGKGAVQNTAVITSVAQYPTTNGAFSSVSVSATVQNPAYAVPARGSLHVIVNVVNDDGGTKQAGDFSIHVNGTNVSPADFSGTSGSGSLVMMDAGGYTIVPSSLSAYQESDPNCLTGTMTAGGNLTCTITENDIATTGTVTVIAQVKNDNSGTLLPGSFPLYLDGALVTSGVPVAGLAPGTHIATASAAPSGYTASTWGYDCDTSGNVTVAVGQKKTCIIIFDDNAPASLACADAAMILDRTGSMSGQSLTDESAAAKQLLTLYNTVTNPMPKVAVGSIGGLDGSAASIAPGGTLGVTLASLLASPNGVISTVTGSNSSVGSDLSAGIAAGQAELLARGTTPKKVLILVSDGVPNKPTGSTPADTGWKAPTASAQNAVGDSWTCTGGATQCAGAPASDSAGHRELYVNHGFSIPTGATIAGIEVKPTAWSSSVAGAPQSPVVGPLSASSVYDLWATNGTTNKVTAVNANDGNTTYISETTNGDGETYLMGPAGVPTGSTITSVTLTAQAAESGGTANIILRAEKGSGTSNRSDDGGHSLTSTSYSAVTRTMTLNPFTNAAWTVSEVNGWTTRFGVVKNNSTGGTPRVTQLSLTVTYTPPPSTCTLGVDMSWNSGISWSTEKTQVLTTTSQVYTLGSPSDDWATAHTWQSTEFSNTNFRLRIHDTNAGPTCHVDALQARVSYTTAVDPTQAALNAADAAKLAGIDLVTIHFGDTAGRTLLAQLATGSTANAPHQPGSAFDQSATVVSGDTGYKAASVAGTPSQWATPDKAYVSDNAYATDSTGNHQQAYTTFGLVVPNSSSVKGVEVSVEAKSTDNSGCQVGAELSIDGGTTFTSSGYVTAGSIAASDTVYPIGGAASLWGKSTTAPFMPGDFIDGKFVVRLANIHTASCTSTATLSVDQVRVRVYYSTVAENVDGDNFFISPDSQTMANIFYAVGAQVCPAAVAPPPAAAPTKGTLLVITHVINDNGGTAQASDFTMNVNGTNPSLASFVGVESPGVAVTLDPGSYNISPAPSVLFYNRTLGASCGAGSTITAGDVLTCTVTYDDFPPSPAVSPTPPPPPSTINIGTWGETP